MPQKKIHCDLWEIFGPDWANLTLDQVECLANTVHTMELLGDEPDRRGFVGTQRIDGVVGGYFAVQYEEQELHYKERDQLERRPSTPFQRLFFALFAKTGKLLLQNAKLANIPLTQEKTRKLFFEALELAFKRCQVGQLIGLSAPPTETPDISFIDEFEQSDRVVKLLVTYPDPNKIPDEFVYYNPQREKNAIVRDSHRHDYANFKKVDLEANPSGDIKKTHIAKDLVRAATVQLLVYRKGADEFVLEREVPRRFEFRVDMDSDRVPLDDLVAVLDMLRLKRAVQLDTPTALHSGDQQMSIFDSHNESDDEN